MEARGLAPDGAGPEPGFGLARGEEAVPLEPGDGGPAVAAPVPPAPDPERRRERSADEQGETDEEQPPRRCSGGAGPGGRGGSTMDEEKSCPVEPAAPEDGKSVAAQEAADRSRGVEEDEEEDGDGRGGSGDHHPQRFAGLPARSRVAPDHWIHPSRSGSVPSTQRVRRSATPSPRTFISA